MNSVISGRVFVLISILFCACSALKSPSLFAQEPRPSASSDTNGYQAPRHTWFSLSGSHVEATFIQSHAEFVVQMFLPNNTQHYVLLDRFSIEDQQYLQSPQAKEDEVDLFVAAKARIWSLGDLTVWSCHGSVSRLIVLQLQTIDGKILEVPIQELIDEDRFFALNLIRDQKNIRKPGKDSSEMREMRKQRAQQAAIQRTMNFQNAISGLYGRGPANDYSTLGYSTHSYHIGPRGGIYYYNSNGNKQYVPR